MVPITTPDSIEYVEIFMKGPWYEASPPQQYPTFKSYVSSLSDETPQFIIVTTKNQKITLDFKPGSQIYIDGNIFRYHRDATLNLRAEDI